MSGKDRLSREPDRRRKITVAQFGFPPASATTRGPIPAVSGSCLGDGTEATFSTALVPGVALAAGVAAAAVLAEGGMRRVTGGFALPALVIALLMGLALILERLSAIVAMMEITPSPTGC